MNRISLVESININDISLASTLHVGDCGVIHSTMKALALQREVSIFFENEGDFSDFEFFSREIERPIVDENVTMITENRCPIIKVGSIRIISTAVASGVVIGSLDGVSSEARRKHFRQFVDG